MSTTQHTGHYNLPTFGDSPNDRPSWRGDFTDAMTKIDNQMYANATNITTATAAANNAKTAADAAKKSADAATNLAQANKADIAEQASYFNALGVTSVPTAQNLMSTINGKAEDSDLTTLQGTVSSLSSIVSGKANTADVYTRSQADARYTKQGGYSGTAQDLNTSISQNAGSLEALLKSLKPIQILSQNFNFYGIGANNSGRANVRAFAIPGCKIALARLMVYSDNSDTLVPGKWPGSPLGNSNPEQPTTQEVTTSAAVVAGNIPKEYRPSIPFRGYTDFSLSVPWGLGVEIWPNGDIQIYKFSGGTIPSGTHINAPGFNMVWTYGQTGI